MSAVNPANGHIDTPAWRRQLGLHWRALAPRERLAIGLAAWALGVLLLWLVGVQPALRTLRDAPLQIDAVEAQLQAMQAMAAETVALRSSAPVSKAQAVAALTSATEAMGSKGRLVIQGDRAVLTLTAADTESLRQWLELARTAARARPVEAQWSRAANGYTGTLVVSLGSAP
jgi:general secretion pathway protein M